MAYLPYKFHELILTIAKVRFSRRGPFPHLLCGPLELLSGAIARVGSWAMAYLPYKFHNLFLTIAKVEKHIVP